MRMRSTVFILIWYPHERRLNGVGNDWTHYNCTRPLAAGCRCSSVAMEEELEIQLREGAKRRKRPCSASFVAVRAALYQLTRLNDFRAEKIGGGFYADVFKVGNTQG